LFLPDRWAKLLPQDETQLWDSLVAFDRDSEAALFAHCASLSVNAVHEPWNRNPRCLAHADTLACVVTVARESSSGEGPHPQVPVDNHGGDRAPNEVAFRPR
jgi:hypothetical protein